MYENIYLPQFLKLGGHTVEEDVYVISEVVEKYIYGYPWHLPGKILNYRHIHQLID